MESRDWGIIGGAVLVLGLLYFFMGSSKSVEVHYQDAENLYKHRNYKQAIENYNKAIKLSKKIGTRSEIIDRDFPALANYKIALCYDKLAETTKEGNYHEKAISHIRKTLNETDAYKHRENLYYLWAQVLYKSNSFQEAEAKFSYFINEYPNSINVVEALNYIGTINLNSANNSKAQAAFNRIIDEFPTSKYRNDAENHVAQLLVENKNIPLPYPEDEKMYTAALEEFKKNAHYEAYRLFFTIIKQYPNSKYVTFAYEGIGDIYSEAENFVKAREFYDNAKNKTSDINRIDKLGNKKDRTFLVPATSDLKIQPKLNSEMFIKPILLRKEGKYFEAALLFEQLSKSEIPSEDVIYALYWGGYCYYKYYKVDTLDQNMLSKSAELFSRITREYGDRLESTQTYYYLASVYSDWGKILGGDISKYQLVIQTVNMAEEKFGDNLNSSDQKWMREMKKFKQEALTKIDPPEPSEPDSVPVIVNLVSEGYKFLNQGNLDSAEKMALDALNADRNNKRAYQLLSDIKTKHYDLGWDFLDAEEYKAAIAKFENCIRIDPEFKKAYCNLGVTFIYQEEYSKAINELNMAIYIDSEYKEAYFNIGLAYLRLGMFDNAKNAAEKALEIDPKYEAARVLRNSIAD